MNRVEVLERMEPILNTQVRTMEHNPRTRVTVTPEMVTLRPGGGQRHLEMTTGGVQSLANFVGLPWNLAAKLRPETFGTVATELLGRQNRYALMIKEGAITAVAKPTEFRSLNPNRVLTAIEGGIRGCFCILCLVSWGAVGGRCTIVLTFLLLCISSAILWAVAVLP
ncbi:hypothetical protein ES703_88073 [subsurface metagenome]